MSFFKRAAAALSKSLEIIEKEGAGKFVKKLHLYNGIRPTAKLVGSDQFGNKYFEDTQDGLSLRDRWVELNCESKYVVNASNVPPEWHSWLHHIVESAPTEDPRPKPIFQLEHVPTDLSKMAFKANYVPPGYPVKPVDIKEDTKISTKRYKSWEPKL